MTFEMFDEFFDEFIKECRKMRDTKGKEYASGVDRFANFNRLSTTLEIDRLKIAQVYVQKHLDSVNTYIKTGQIHSTERIRGRFVDIVTYMILMAGMVEERENSLAGAEWGAEAIRCSARSMFWTCSLFPNHSGNHMAFIGHDINKDILEEWSDDLPAPNTKEVEIPF